MTAAAFDTALDEPQWPEFLAPFSTALRERLRLWQRLFDTPGAMEDLERQQVQVLSRLASRVLASEMRELAAQGALRGDDGRARHRDFVERFTAEPRWRETLLSTYPVLAGHLEALAQQFERNLLRCLERLEKDFALLTAHLHLRAPPRLRSLTSGLSDPHAGGQSVSVLQLAGGERILHKPRSSAIDGWFDAWAARLGAAAPEFALLGAARHVDRGTHSWVSFVDARECDTASEVDGFHRRQGALLALAWFLAGGDFHHENVVAHGHRPVLIDLEALLLPGAPATGFPAAGLPAWWHGLASSVLGSGLAPSWVATVNGAGLFVTSGLDGVGDRPPRLTWPRWTGLGTDALRLELHPREVAQRPCRARLDGQDVPLATGLDRVVEGFEVAYDALRACRPEDIPLPAGCRTRVILRDTRAYQAMLDRLLAPDLLRSRDAQDAAITRLLEGPRVFDGLPAAVGEAERQALWRRDIPSFLADPATGEVEEAGNRGIVVASLPAGWQEVRRRFALASPPHRAWSSALLRASVQVAAEPLGQPMPPGDAPGDLLLPVRAIADAMARQAIRGPWGATWLDFHRTPRGQVGQHVVGGGLYAGAGGIALALACVAAALDSDTHAGTAREALRFADGWWADLPPGMPAFPQGPEGPLGLAWVEAACARLLGDPSLLARGLERAERALRQPVPQGAVADFLGGFAGSVAALLALFEQSGDSRFLQAAREFGERILQAERGAQEGGGWPIRGRAVLGLAHGASGIGMVLARLHRHTGDTAWRSATERALAFEARHFDAREKDWPDLRTPSEQPSFLGGWCGGAAGAGAARLAIAENLAVEAPASLAQELEIATASVERRAGTDFGGDHLCCGESGRLLYLARVGEGQPRLRAACCAGAWSLLRRFDASGCLSLSAVRESRVVHGLFNGTGGVALALLAASGARGAARVDPLTLSLEG